MRRPTRKTAFTILLLALAYFVTGRLGLLLPAFGSQITLVWLPAGVAVAALTRWGFGCWPGVSLGSLAVNLAVGASLPAALGIAVGNTLGPLAAAWALPRMGFHPAFDRSRDILLLAAAAALGMLATSGLGVATLSFAGTLPAAARVQAWLTWWAGDALGVIAAAPLVLTFSRAELESILRRRAEFLLWIFAIVATTWAVFITNRGVEPGGALALAFVPLPFVVWAGLRFGPVGTSVGLILLGVGAAYGTATRSGPFYRSDPLQEVSLVWLFMATSAVLGWLTSALNTARRQSVGVQRLFEQALTDVSLGVLLAGLDRRITYANQGFTRLTGYTEAELLGKSCALLQGPETDPAVGGRLKAALRGEGFFDGEILNYRKDGSKFWNALLISPVRDEGGAMTGFLGIQRDVTQRKRAELALRQSEEHLRLIIELEPECVKLLSPEGRLIEMNPAGLAMIEAGSLEEVRDCPVSDLIVPEDRAAFAEMHRRVMQGGSGRCEFAIVGLKGSRRWMETHAVPYRDGRREIIGVLGITRDVTERRKAGAELERSLSTLHLLINSVPAYISFVDVDERYRLVNRLYEEYYGVPAEQLVGRRLRDVQPAAVYAEMQPHVRAALSGNNVRYEFRPTGPDGKSRWLDVQYVPRRGEDGAVSGFFVLVFDISESRKTEAAMRQSETRFRTLFENAGDAIFLMEGSQFVECNARALAMFGCQSRDQIAGHPPFEFSPPRQPDGRDSTESAMEKIASALAGRLRSFEWTHLRRDGTPFRAEVTLNRVEFGDKACLQAIVRDITERKLAERAQREREEQFRSLADNLPDVVARFDRERRHLYINPAAEAATGLKPEAFIGRTNEELGMPQENTAIWKATLDRVFETGADERFVFSYPGPTGIAFWESHVVAERGADGRIESALVLSRDITQLRQAELARQEALARLQKIASQLPGVVYQFRLRPDGTSCFPFASEAMRTIYRVSPEEIREDASKVFSVLHPDDYEGIVASIRASARDLMPWRHEYRVRFPDGTERWLYGNSLPQRESDGATLWHGFITDITERKHSEFEREQLDRKIQETQKLESLGVLAGGIAHDFNNLLTTILGNASIAQSELPPGSPSQDCLEQITEASKRAGDLCKQMLAYSGRGRFIVQKLDLGQLVEQTAQMLQISISKKAALRYRLEKGLPAVEVDATQIRQVIMNLVINASEAIGDKSGVISLSTGLTRVGRDYLHGTLMDPDVPAGDYVYLEVSDSGEGMSAETKAKIFDPFFTTKFTGRGLGLAAVMGIVRGHKGALKVYSELGRGTTFKLLFPAVAGAGEAEPTAPVAVPSWRGEGTVLVVDDEETMRSTMARMMRMIGLDPVLASDGREAVEIFRQDPRRFALVLLDLTMPHLDGEQTFTELRRLRPDVRVVLMSGFNSQEALVRFNGQGLANFLQKPFTVGALRAVVQGALT